MADLTAGITGYYEMDEDSGSRKDVVSGWELQPEATTDGAACED